MTEERIHTWARRRRVRVVALAAVIVGPLAAVPFLLASTATAASPSTAAVAACLNAPESITELSFDGPAGTATVELNGPGCQTISLVSYDTPGLPLANGDAQYPQTEVAADTVTVTQADGIVTLNVAEPRCFSQLDLIYGLNQDGTSTILQTLNPVLVNGQPTGPYSAEGILIDHKDFQQPSCNPTTSSSGPTTSSSQPTTSSSQPTTSSSQPTTSSSQPTTLSTSVLPTSTSRAPTGTTSAVATKSTAVLPFTTTRPPLNDATGGALPFTGSNLPVRDGVLGGLALVTFGGLLVLVAGRTKRRAGTHRVG